jgi:hypothetical protein
MVKYNCKSSITKLINDPYVAVERLPTKKCLFTELLLVASNSAERVIYG